MTEEELEKKAEEYAEEKTNTDSDFEKSILFQAYKDGYKHGQEEIGYLKECLEENRGLKDTVIKLKAQIEKMKCCGNCRKIFICKKADKSGMGSYPYNCKEWELAE